MESLRMQANEHAERAVRLFRWATIIGEAGRLGHMPYHQAEEISAKINRQAVEESNKAIGLRRQLAVEWMSSSNRAGTRA
ncbi:MAG TPA: hypothetical protein VIL74_20735 [Pyrinomonadaceae bacterium]|jgi:hypothetical protein